MKAQTMSQVVGHTFALVRRLAPKGSSTARAIPWTLAFMLGVALGFARPSEVAQAQVGAEINHAFVLSCSGGSPHEFASLEFVSNEPPGVTVQWRFRFKHVGQPAEPFSSFQTIASGTTAEVERCNAGAGVDIERVEIDAIKSGHPASAPVNIAEVTSENHCSSFACGPGGDLEDMKQTMSIQCAAPQPFEFAQVSAQHISADPRSIRVFFEWRINGMSFPD